jgi:hypothetical protein
MYSADQAALNRVAVAPSEPATEQKSDPFLMDALYVLAWQRKLDRSRAMALTLRLSLLPMIKKNYLRSAVQTWRERVRQLKTPVIVVQPMAFSPIAVKPQEYRQPAVSKGPMWNVCYTPASARSFQTAVSVSSFGSSSSPLEDSPHSSDFTVSSLGSTPSMSTGSPFAFHALPTLNRSSTRDLGEAIGTHGLKRSDSDMYYMIHAMKGNDSPVPTHCHVPSPKPKPLGRLRY